MVRTISLEGDQRLEPPSYSGTVKTCKQEDIIRRVLGESKYSELYLEAARSIDPDCPEWVLLHAALSCNALERPRIMFYDRLELGKLDDDSTENAQSWARKLPDDDGETYRKTAQFMKWR